MQLRRYVPAVPEEPEWSGSPLDEDDAARLRVLGYVE